MLTFQKLGIFIKEFRYLKYTNSNPYSCYVFCFNKTEESLQTSVSHYFSNLPEQVFFFHLNSKKLQYVDV